MKIKIELELDTDNPEDRLKLEGLKDLFEELDSKTYNASKVDKKRKSS